MAIPTWVANGTFTTSGAADCTPPLPAGHTTNDILLIVSESMNSEATPGTPTGYDHVANSPSGVAGFSGTTSTKISMFWKRDNGSESNPTLGSASLNHCMAIVMAFRGCITTGNPWDVTAAGSDNDSGETSVAIPGGTTTVNDCLIVAGCAVGTDTNTSQFSGWANADLSDVTERANNNSTVAGGGGFGVACGGKATAGTFGNTTATLVTAAARAYLMIALKPPLVLPAAPPIGFIPI